MKTTKRDVLDDLEALIATLYANADSYLLSAKAYNCRSTEAIKSGLVKGAAVMRINASKVQAIIGKHKDPASGQAHTARSPRPAAAAESVAVAEVGADTSAQDRQMAAGSESPDQAAGQVDVRSVRTDHPGD